MRNDSRSSVTDMWHENDHMQKQFHTINKEAHLRKDTKMLVQGEQAKGRLELWCDILQPLSTAIWKIRREREGEKSLFYSSTKIQPSLPCPPRIKYILYFWQHVDWIFKSCELFWKFHILGYEPCVFDQNSITPLYHTWKPIIPSYEVWRKREPNWFSMGRVSTKLVMINSFLC